MIENKTKKCEWAYSIVELSQPNRAKQQSGSWDRIVHIYAEQRSLHVA